MARPGKVWRNRHKRNAWYATIDGIKVRLAEPEADEAEAREKYRQAIAKQDAPKLGCFNTMEVIIELYLEAVAKDHPKSFKHHKGVLNGFLRAVPSCKVHALKIPLVQGWLAAHPNWSSSTIHVHVSTLQAALNWASLPEQGIIERNPIAGFQPGQLRSRGRTALLSPEHRSLLYAAADEHLREYLLALEESGNRPVCVARVTAADCLWDCRAVRLEEHKTAEKTGDALLIPMSARWEAQLRELARRYPTGALYRTKTGRPWSTTYAGRLFKRLREKLKLPGSPTLYYYRHTFATDLLKAGMSMPKVAALLGHESPATTMQHYGHLDGHMRDLVTEMESLRGQRAETARDAG